MSKEELEQILEQLEQTTNIRFARLLALCEEVFGEPRVKGSHHFFKMPWAGKPLVNLQRAKGGRAKPYQVKQVRQAIERFIEESFPSEEEE